MAQSFNCVNLSAPDRNIGASSSLVIPCIPGDEFMMTGTLRLVSGGMQPRLHLDFMDAAQTTVVASLVLLAVITDSGWHISSEFGIVPAGAQVAVLRTDCT
jgi:hypothetical protein